ncbi:hypothetical protein BC936DRAFT_149621, partial [Jimgerdemannia flammicorona]
MDRDAYESSHNLETRSETLKYDTKILPSLEKPIKIPIMADAIPTTPLPFTTLPPAVPPTSRFNIIKTWWYRSERTSEVSEARILTRLQFFGLADRFETAGSAATSNTNARVGLVDLGDGVRKINTLVVEQNGNEFVVGTDGSPKIKKGDAAGKREGEQGFLAEMGYTPKPQTQLDFKSNASPTMEEIAGEQKHNLVMCHGYGA